MTVKERAIEYHHKGFNCAQAVLSACSEYTGLEEKTSLAVAGGMGGGVRCGEICGSVSGGVMAIGMANPYNTEKDEEAKKKIAALTVEYTKTVKEHFGCLRCKDLKRKKLSCDELIGYCAEEAEKLIIREKNTIEETE